MTEKTLNEQWIDWAMEIQAIAQNGLSFAKGAFDLERYGRLRDISAEMLSFKTGIPLKTVQGFFCSEKGYQTPKIDTRAAVFKEGKILLVHENSGLWALPGGWVDVMETVASNTAKEVSEEAGLEVQPSRLIALLDGRRRNCPQFPFAILKVFVLCDLKGGAFRANSETMGIGYFAADDLPPLATHKCNADQIDMCFRAARDERWEVLFD